MPAPPRVAQYGALTEFDTCRTAAMYSLCLQRLHLQVLGLKWHFV